MSKAAPMVEMFADLAERRADHPALVGAARTVTYADLWTRANRVANPAHRGRGAGSRAGLRGLGRGPGTC